MNLLARLRIFLRGSTVREAAPDRAAMLDAIAAARLPRDVTAACIDAFFHGAEVVLLPPGADNARRVGVRKAPRMVHEVLAEAGFWQNPEGPEHWYLHEGVTAHHAKKAARRSARRYR